MYANKFYTSWSALESPGGQAGSVLTGMAAVQASSQLSELPAEEG